MKNNYSSIVEARHKLWKMANLSYLLDDNQKILYQMYKENGAKVLVWNLARGSGKSRTLCIIAIEECLRNPKALIKYACARQKDARQIIQPLIRDLLEDCPPELRCTYLVSEGAYRFPNGAQLQIAGLDSGRAESLRGGSAMLAIVDEAGLKNLKKDLKYIVDSILYPAVTRTKEINGKIILASTMPITHDHPFIYYLRVAEIEGAALTRTVYSNPRMTPEMINGIIKQYGGVHSAAFRREYLCECIINDEDAVVPEFTKEIQDKTIREWPRPPFFDGYVAMDLGLKDLTVVLFAYYDFKANKIIIEDEYVLNGAKFTTKELAENIKVKESTIFTDTLSGEYRAPYKRVSDNNLIVINDLYHLHGLQFFATKKDDADAALNNMRMMIAAEQVIINPRCKTLIRHLQNATWNKSRTSFDRSADNGHYDACFTPEMKVLTSTGMKKICDIKEGDLVLTHEGNFKKVNALLSRDYKGDILELRFKGVETIHCTPDHKFWTSTKNNTSWIEAQDLVKDSEQNGECLVNIPESKTQSSLERSNSYYYDGRVYSLEVEEDHSYTVHGAAVKNCDSLKYLIRNINFQNNPYPAGYGNNFRQEDYFGMRKQSSNNYESLVKTMLNIKNR